MRKLDPSKALLNERHSGGREVNLYPQLESTTHGPWIDHAIITRDHQSLPPLQEGGGDVVPKSPRKTSTPQQGRILARNQQPVVILVSTKELEDPKPTD